MIALTVVAVAAILALADAVEVLVKVRPAVDTVDRAMLRIAERLRRA